MSLIQWQFESIHLVKPLKVDFKSFAGVSPHVPFIAQILIIIDPRKRPGDLINGPRRSWSHQTKKLRLFNHPFSF